MRRMGLVGRRIAVGLAALVVGALWVQGCGATETGAAKENVEDADPAQTEDSMQIEGSMQTERSAWDAAEGAGEKEGVKEEEGGQAEDAAADGAEEGAEAEADSPLEALHVEGTSLMDSGNHPVQLRGISTHGIAWFPDYINEACFEQLHEEWGVNVIRLAMYTAEYGGYCTGGDKEELKRLVKDGVTYATNQNMYVIIDWHILSDGNPGTYLEEAKDFFAEMAETYAGQSNVLYEICNEPNGGIGWTDIKAYAEEVIGVIRSYDEDAVILVGTPNWCQYVDQAAADPITGYDNIMYTLHFYAATHKDSLRDAMKAAVEAGLPIFVSEFGICDASGNGAIDAAQADEWVRAMDACGISYVAWNLSNKNETCAIINSGCGKTYGFEESDLSDSGKWLYQTLTGSR